jgi:hypothetical protein
MYSFFASLRRAGIFALVVFLLAALGASAFAATPRLTISGTPPTSVVAGQTYAFQPTAHSKFGRPLTFSISNKPSWASFSPYSGALGGAPQSTDSGTYVNIVISVSDGRRTASLPAFPIDVRAASTSASAISSNGAPTIGGRPSPQVLAGSSYLFTPAVSDPDGDTLTFSVSNAPAWASFSTSTGALSGTPSAAQVGTYNNISISASDGRGGSASLPAFSIAVVSAANGSATISWMPPTQNMDGSALTDLAGYSILYGTTRGGPYASMLTLSNPGLTSYVISDLVPGTYYFVVTARNASGVESQYSSEASKTIN